MIKCIKCGLRFKDRKDPEDGTTVNKELCWNCRSIWKFIGLLMQAISPKLNRDVAIKLDDVIIRKHKKPYWQK